MKAALLTPLLLLFVPQEATLPVHAGGRVAGDGRFGWPGVYFEGRFKGTRVTAKAETDEPLRVLVDGRPAGMIRPGERSFTASGLGDAPHTVRLEKVTESQTGGPRFLGFTTAGRALPAPRRARQIEFIGDSHTVGYGNTSPVRECDAARVRATTDTQLAFGPITAKRLDADYRVIAYSGFGVVRNYNGVKPGQNLPFLYPRIVPGGSAFRPAADEPGWRPQAIVINLGTNDFSTPLKPGEPWENEAKLRADYRGNYVTFVRWLKREQPQAKFVLMAADNFAADVVQVAERTGAQMLRVPKLEMTGCNWHPSLADHRLMADMVEKAVAPLLP